MYYYISIVDSVLAKFIYFFKFVAINRRAPEGPHLRSACLFGTYTVYNVYEFR